MRAWECPACGHGYVHRSGRRCRRCRAQLLMPGERFIAGEPAYVWTATGWAELLSGKPARRQEVAS